MSDDYTCDLCGGTFHNTRSEDEANAEAFENFGIRNANRDPEMAVLCDDCYRQVLDWWTSNDGAAS